MFVISANNLNTATHKALKALVSEGSTIKNDKGEGFSESKELHPCYLQIENPVRRVLTLNKRKANISATVAETLWVLFGENKINQIEHYMPRAKDFSDDGISWRAWYGERLFDWQNKGISQFEYCYKTLSQDIYSRQAVMSLWDPTRECTVGSSKDFPCSNHVQFLYRDGKLNTTVTMRSNDCLWGWSHINMFEFSVMQELMALKLGVPVGKYYHQANSFHIYECMYERAHEIIDSNLEEHLNPDVKHSQIQNKAVLPQLFQNMLGANVAEWQKLFLSLNVRIDSPLSTELCWLICLLFEGSTKGRRMESGKRLLQIVPQDVLREFCDYDYALALALSLGFTGFNNVIDALKEIPKHSPV